MNAASERKTRKRFTRTGFVTSTGGEKTVSVSLDNVVKHPRYGKYIHRRSKLAVHDPKGQANLGDQVEIAPCRPISKTKSWRLVRVVRQAKLPVRPAQKA